MCITAHPDDEAGGFGGSLRLYRDRGVETSVVCLTPGQAATHRGGAANDQELAAARRKEFAAFGWDPAQVPDPQSPATFQRSKLNWDERTQPPHAEILDWYRQLIALRRSTPDLTDPNLTHTHVRFSESEQWLVMERGSVTVAFSLAPNPIQVEVHPNSTIALASTPDIHLNNNSLTLPSDSVAVLMSG